MKRKFNNDIEREIYLFYKLSGGTYSSIGKKYGVNYGIISNIIKRKATKFNCHNRKYYANFDIFNTINSEEKAYWLGFLYADGYVRLRYFKKNIRGGVLGLNLAIKDLDHLKLYKNFLNADQDIQYGVKKTRYKNIDKEFKFCHLEINNLEMVQQLINKGCVPRKSLILKFPDEFILPENLIFHFIRGYFDGDGTICKTKVNTFRCCILGTKNFLKSIQTILQKYDIKSSIINKHKSKIFNLNILEGSKGILKFKKLLYDNSNIFLSRKKYIFDTLTFDLKENYFKRRSMVTPKIKQFDLKGNLIETWDCLRDILISNNFWNKSTIRSVLKKRNKTAYGFKWSYV